MEIEFGIDESREADCVNRIRPASMSRPDGRQHGETGEDGGGPGRSVVDNSADLRGGTRVKASRTRAYQIFALPSAPAIRAGWVDCYSLQDRSLGIAGS